MFARSFGAAAFLFLLLCEVGSHALLDIHHHEHDELPAAIAAGVPHTEAHAEAPEQECEPAVLCESSRPQDPQSPNFGDQASHHDVLFSSIAISFNGVAKRVKRFGFLDISGDFRYLAPPYHPPKLT